ncbi:MAG: heparinase II/III family protein, partial [Clostridia bacterium]|nr:heparinase II/III family protein [Clostridia bacterium]
LMSVDKHLTQAEVKSRESDHPPVLELVVNGMPQKIVASKDIMIRGGAYGGQNYGSDEILTIQESGYYKNFDANTRRAIIAFDISGLKSTDTVNSATLKVYGRNASGTGEKEICVYDYSEMSFIESTAVFDDFDVDCAIWSCNDLNTWDFITSNSTSIKGKSCAYHRGNDLSEVADMYSYTKDERYAYTFIRQYMGLVYHVGFNTGVFNQLDIAQHTKFTSKNIFQVLNSKYMTGEILTASIKTMWLQTQDNIFNFFGTKDNNWATYATGGAAAFLSRFRELAVFDEWYELIKAENLRVMKGFVLEDGMSLELPLTYTQVISNTIYAPFEVQEETGIPVAYGDDVFDIAYNIVKTIVYCSSPGWRGFNIADGNDYQTSFDDIVKKWYIMVFSDDEMFEYVATKGTSGAMPENPTTRYPLSLRTYMRSSWDSDAIAMSFINTNDHSASHGQRDHLSIALFAYGKFLLTDPGLGTSLLDGAKEDISSAPVHNLVTVNNSEHDAINSTRELGFESNDIYDFVEYAGTYTQKVDQHRSVLYLKDQKFFIVSDYASPEDQSKENSFEQNWQMLPSSKISVDEQTLEIRSNNDDININLVPVGTDDLTYYYEDTTFCHKTTLEKNKKAVLKKTAVGDAVFNTIILPRNLKEDFEVSADIIDTGIEPTAVNAFSARIKNTKTGKENYYYYYHLNDLSKKQAAKVGQFTTDATTMLVETDLDGNITSTFLMDATFLKDNTIDEEEQYLFKVKDGAEPVSAIAYEKNGQIFNVYSSTLTEEVLENVTMYAPGQ